MKILDVKQGSTEWLMARCGLPTASEFDNLVTPEWKARTGQGVETYMMKKIAERVMGHPAQTGGSFAMEQGSIMESEAYPWFEFAHGKTVQRVGFITTDDGRIGCSPDGLLGDNNGLEIKCPEPHTHLKYLLGGVVPKEYLAQVHGAMFVTERPRWTFISYSRYFPALVVEVERDEAVQTVLRNALSGFLVSFDAGMTRIGSMLKQGGR